jgi:hypothetical protein
MNVTEKLKAIGGEAMSSEATLRNSYECAKSIIEDGILGDFVECGVYTGCQCGAMALAIQELGSDRKIHCFDSFRGFPKASEKDSLEWQQKLGVGSSTDPSLPLDPAWGFSSHIDVAHVQSNFLKWGFPLDMFVFHEGWFQDTTKEWNGAIALLRIDGDLYDSVLVCLKNLYPYLVAGGICILDDYDLEGGRRAFDEYFQGSLVPTSTNPAWCVK